MIRSVGVEEPGNIDIERYYSGDGRELKRNKKLCNGTPECSWYNVERTYYIRSSVLGGEVVSEADSTGKKTKTNIYAAGSKVAVQSEYTYQSTTTESVQFEHFDASGMSFRSSISNGNGVFGGGDYDGAPGEFDPLGGNAGLESPRFQRRRCRLDHRRTFGTSIDYLLNIRQLTCDPHSWQASQKLSSVWFCTDTRVEDGDDAAVGAAADQTPDPLFQ